MSYNHYNTASKLDDSLKNIQFFERQNNGFVGPRNTYSVIEQFSELEDFVVAQEPFDIQKALANLSFGQQPKKLPLFNLELNDVVYNINLSKPQAGAIVVAYNEQTEEWLDYQWDGYRFIDRINSENTDLNIVFWKFLK